MVLLAVLMFIGKVDLECERWFGGGEEKKVGWCTYCR